MYLKPVSVYKEFMKKLFSILFLLSAFISNAQRTMFGSNNNYVAQVVVAPPALVTADLVLNLDAGNTASYIGSGNSWNDLSGSNNGTLIKD